MSKEIKKIAIGGAELPLGSSDVLSNGEGIESINGIYGKATGDYSVAIGSSSLYSSYSKQFTANDTTVLTSSSSTYITYYSSKTIILVNTSDANVSYTRNVISYSSTNKTITVDTAVPTGDYTSYIISECKATANGAIALGEGTQATLANQFVVGKNNSTLNNGLFIVGKGTAYSKSNAFGVDSNGNCFITGSAYAGTSASTSASYKLQTQNGVNSLINTHYSNTIVPNLNSKLDNYKSKLIGTKYGFDSVTLQVDDLEKDILVKYNGKTVYLYGCQIIANYGDESEYSIYSSCSYTNPDSINLRTIFDDAGDVLTFDGFVTDYEGPYVVIFGDDGSDEDAIGYFYTKGESIETSDLITLPVLQEGTSTTIDMKPDEQNNTRITLTKDILNSGIWCTPYGNSAYLYLTLFKPDGHTPVGDEEYITEDVGFTCNGKSNVLNSDMFQNLLYDFYGTWDWDELVSYIEGCILDIYEYGYDGVSDKGLSIIEYGTPDVKATKQSVVELEIEWEDESLGTSTFKLIGVE